MNEMAARLTANIAAGRAPLDDEMLETMRQLASAGLEVPGPRVAQLLARYDALVARARHLAEHHPDPAAAGAALRILGDQR